jgi:hypothetical protein
MSQRDSGYVAGVLGWLAALLVTVGLSGAWETC